MGLFTSLVGVMGLLILLVAFIFNVRKKTRYKITLYYLMQLIGSGLLFVYAYLTASQIFFILEGVWGLVAAYFLYENVFDSKYKNKSKVKIKFENKKRKSKK